MLRRSTGEMSILHVVGVRISTSNQPMQRRASLEFELHFHRMGNMRAAFKALHLHWRGNRPHRDPNRCLVFNQWAKRKPGKDVRIFAQFRSDRPFLEPDADAVCRLRVSAVALATCFCAAGRTFDDITQKAKHTRAVVCRSGHFPRHRRLHKDRDTTLLFTVWPVWQMSS